MSKPESPTYDSSIAEKANAPLAKKLRALVGADSRALADYLGCSVQAVNQYKNGVAYPKTENLIKIAEYYGISVDYLLGLTGVPNRDTRIQSAHDITGLSVGAICKLHDMKKDNQKTGFLDIISLLIEDENAEFFLGLLSALFSCLNTDSGKEIIQIDIDGKPLSLWKENHLMAVLESHFIENLSNLAQIYRAQSGEK